MQTHKNRKFDALLTIYGDKIVKGLNRDVEHINNNFQPLMMNQKSSHLKSTNSKSINVTQGSYNTSPTVASRSNSQALGDESQQSTFASIDQVMDEALYVCKYQKDSFIHEIYARLFFEYGCTRNYEAVTQLMKELDIVVVNSVSIHDGIELSRYFLDYGRIHFHSSQKSSKLRQDDWVDIPKEYTTYLDAHPSLHLLATSPPQTSKLPSLSRSLQKSSAYVDSIFNAMESFLQAKDEGGDVGTVEENILNLTKLKCEGKCFYAVLSLSSVEMVQHIKLVRFTYHKNAIHMFMSDENFGETRKAFRSAWHGVPERFLMFLKIHIHHKHDIVLKSDTKLCRKIHENVQLCMMHHIYDAFRRDVDIELATRCFDTVLLMLIAFYGIGQFELHTHTIS